MKRKKTAIVSGYFDPLHIGHIEYFKLAKELADELVVIVNNREQCLLKKSDEFMDERDRLEIVYHLDMVDEVLISTDKDKTVCKSLEMIAQFKPYNDLVFCNGGDRDASNSPVLHTYTNMEGNHVWRNRTAFMLVWGTLCLYLLAQHAL